MPDIEDLTSKGEIIVTEGNRPFITTDADSIWIVKEGRVNFYCVDNEGEPGRRYYLCTMEKNDFFIGGISYEKYGILCSGEPGTEILKLALEDLGDKLPSYIDKWIVFITKKINCRVPKNSKLLVENHNIEIEKHETFSSMDKVLWVKHIEGSSFFLERDDLYQVKGDFYFPVSEYSYLTAKDKSNIKVLTTEEYFREHKGKINLSAFNGTIGKIIKMQIELASEKEEKKLKEKKSNEAFHFRKSIEKIASSIGGNSESSTGKGEKKDFTFEACRIVGEKLGIKLKEPLAETEENRFYSYIYMITKASKIRIRKVTLTDKWWQKDSGPLLGFLKNGDSPVALIPSSLRSYNIIDPGTDKKIQVTQETSSSLHNSAYVFYKPLLEKKLTFFDIIKFAFPEYKNEILRFIPLGIFIGILGMFFPVATGVFFDKIIPQAKYNMPEALSLALLVSAFSVAIFQILQSIVLIRMDGKMKEPVQSAIWDRILSLPCSFFRQFSSGDLASRSLGIDFISSQLFTGMIFPSILGAIYALFNFILLFRYDTELAVIASGSSFILVLAISFLSYLQISNQRKLAKLQGKISGFIYQVIAGVPKIKVSGSEIMAFSKWAEKFSLQNNYSFKIGNLNNILSVFNSMMPLIMSAIIFTNISSRGSLTGNTVLTSGSFLAFNAAFTSFTGAIMQLGSSIASLMNVVPTLERLKPVFETMPEVNENKIIPGELTGEIDVKHVSFRYNKDGNFAVKDISFHIEPGEFVAFVGHSGSGKSTIFRLLLGFEEPEIGSIYYNGKNISDLDLEFLRRQIGVVIQSSKLMTGEIYYNIIGSSLLTIDDAWEASRMAGIEEDIKAMPMGMYTFISEGAGTFSGGQKQRLLIARALVKKPRIILFDEATSALDNKSQGIITESLNKSKATRIVIAHRLSTVIKADRIYVISGGQIVQEGNYEKLMKEEGPFKDMAKRQLA